MHKTMLLVVPPQGGLLEGFSSGVVALANYIWLFNPEVHVKFLDLGPVPLGQVFDCVREAIQGVPGSIFAGVTGTTASYQSMLHVAQAFKRCNSDVVVVFGGHHATAQDRVILERHPCVDLVVRGEGEIAISQLLKHYPNRAVVPNLSFRDGKTIIRTPNAPPLSESILDRLNPTALINDLRSAPGKFNRITYVSARGCPLKCLFCAVGASSIRAKSVPAVVEDLRYLVGDCGYKQVAIEDNFFAHQPRRTLELCAAIERLQKEMNFAWDCQTRVESMRRRDIIEAMARSNCDAVYMGVESLVVEHLKFLGKTIRPDAYLTMLADEVIPAMMNAGINAYINLQLGIPGESRFHHAATLARLSRLGGVARQHGREIAVHPQLHVIYPGTPHFEMAVAAGMFGHLGEEVFEEFVPWEAERQPILKYLGEHFAHGVGGIPIGILEPEALRNGKFKIRERAIDALSRQLTSMRDVSGVTVFRYSDYITTAAAS